ncbi:MAG: isocitrate lyase/PEP mutase family protein [Pseudomonadota bacterium]|nr:isocitrate lyase/PEP mutase family protein [Pseudomonadota bacterium]
MTTTAKSILARRIRDGEFITAPGVFDMISARVADSMGFPAVYMTGSGVVASGLGLPDAGIATYTEMVGHAARIAGGISTPLIADADTGYGGAVNVRHTVRGYERAGVSAIQIEDQAFPKKCGHVDGQKLVPLEEMLTRIKVAQDCRDSDDFLIIARTDARKAAGKDEAMRRCEAFAEAGADILFYEAPADLDEMREIGRNFDLPLMANMVEGGATPIMTPNELAEIGYQIAIFPASGFLAMTQILTNVYQGLRDQGSSTASGAELYAFKDFVALMGFDEIMEFEARYD